MNEQVVAHGTSNVAVAPVAQSVEVSSTGENGDNPAEQFESSSSSPSTMTGSTIFTFMSEVANMIK